MINPVGYLNSRLMVSGIAIVDDLGGSLWIVGT